MADWVERIYDAWKGQPIEYEPGSGRPCAFKTGKPWPCGRPGNWTTPAGNFCPPHAAITGEKR